MRYIEVPGEIDANNRLILYESLKEIKPQQVEIDIIFSDDDSEDYREPTKAEIIADIVESLREYSRGECTPISEMWDDIKIKTTGEINEEGQLILDRPLQETKPQYVDVVMWFIKDDKLVRKLDEFEENNYEKHIALVKELSESRR
ncbi:hypothetical protein [Chamaesiphon polymorphus]|uniref:Uncharacterized protein n=1 Tax=Chamaesiphon polymorphus CCALA 037 TaxID=2107692 RepID=A0A2T1GFK3_9CYAN|nr:hypothetical protein [Chamaesiphon polymorphus]PSB56368.1 hypothetical protein C7B77_12145 [Chamaesiphon polymorphus CCALA 037]